jgi:hypothetical protein
LKRAVSVAKRNYVQPVDVLGMTSVPMPQPDDPTPPMPHAGVARSAPRLAEVMRQLDRYRPKAVPSARRAGRPPVVNATVRRRGD